MYVLIFQDLIFTFIIHEIIQYTFGLRNPVCFVIIQFSSSFYRYVDRTYKTHPRGLIIYGPATAPSLTSVGNVSSTTLLIALAKSNSTSRSEPLPTRNFVTGGISRELPISVTSNNVTLPRCPVIPSNLGKRA